MTSKALSSTAGAGLSGLLERALSLSEQGLELTPKTSVLINFPAENCQQAAELMGALLSANHVNHHCFFNEKGFHNHIVHHLLALYSLGADANFIKSSYDREVSSQRPIDRVEEENITTENWKNFLGQQKYYGNYLDFFSEEIKETSAIEVIQKYVFGNPIEGEMLSRSFAGLFHPLIHWGYGLEFKLDGIVAEGLALNAVEKVTFGGLKLSENLTNLMTNDGARSKLDKQDLVPSFDFRCKENSEIFQPKSGLTAFQILYKISQDPQLADSELHLAEHGNRTTHMSQHPVLLSWLNKWEIDDNCDWKEILERTKELAWMVTVVYASSFDKVKSQFTLNFVLMHLVTSSLFLPVILPSLEPRFRAIFLRCFFKTTVTVWVAHGKVEFRLAECLKDSANLQVPDSQTPKKWENPWMKVLGSAAKHPDEHTTKIIRTLLYNACTYGISQPGYYSCELEGSDLLDSTIFLRAAIMTLNKLDWERKEDDMKFKWY